jgi:mannose/fructose/N-acetylgalactosamine-specific phosphotransferase system component IID
MFWKIDFFINKVANAIGFIVLGILYVMWITLKTISKGLYHHVGGPILILWFENNIKLQEVLKTVLILIFNISMTIVYVFSVVAAFKSSLSNGLILTILVVIFMTFQKYRGNNPIYFFFFKKENI